VTLYEHIGQLYAALSEERAKIAQLQQDIETYKVQLMAKLKKEATNESKNKGTDSK
jgi:hypothetical protein